MNNKDWPVQIAGLAIVAGVVVGLGIWGQLPVRQEINQLRQAVAPAEGLILPVVLGDLEQRLISTGVIDEDKWSALYVNFGDRLTSADPLVINQDNAGYLLNLLWAFGLANQNRILTEGPMATVGETGNFASTGGWTLARGEVMDHYAAHELITLTADQHTLIELVSKNVYRPCCDNSTHFPDCNHGMAMLGLLTLGASQGLGEEELYELALTANRYWFPDAYLTIARFEEQFSRDWRKRSAQELLGADYVSASGLRRIREQTAAVERGLGSSCGV